MLGHQGVALLGRDWEAWSCWSRLGLVVGNVSLGIDFEVSRAQESSIFLLPTDLDVNSSPMAGFYRPFHTSFLMRVWSPALGTFSLSLCQLNPVPFLWIHQSVGFFLVQPWLQGDPKTLGMEGSGLESYPTCSQQIVLPEAWGDPC